MVRKLKTKDSLGDVQMRRWY